MDLSLDRTTSLKCSQIPWGSKIWCGGVRERVKCVLGFVQSEWSVLSREGRKAIYCGSEELAVWPLKAQELPDVRWVPDDR